ncbi:nitroreductase family protein [bacterium]|nr:nitroreductase family protein [bacterium]
MSLYDLIISRRTIREFKRKTIPKEYIEKYINAGRLAPQAANRQPLEFIVVDDDGVLSEIFPKTSLATHLDWKPSLESRPAAYVAVLVNKEIQKDAWADYDVACASENISLAAWEDKIGSCLIGAFDKTFVKSLLKIPDRYDLSLLIALGYPAHKAIIEDAVVGNIGYRRDKDGTFHVPKRKLKDILHYNSF